MKFDGNTLKVLFALILSIGAIFWSTNTTSPQVYDGGDLDFGVGSGTISITNPSEESLPVQFISPVSRSFRVSSNIEGVSGSSTRQDGEDSITQLFEFGLPPGTSEFTIARGNDVSFVANTSTALEAIVDPMDSGTSTIVNLATVLLICGLLYYASNVTDHQWLTSLRQRAYPASQDTSKQDTEPTPVVKDNGQGHALRSYGDNRANIDK